MSHFHENIISIYWAFLAPLAQLGPKENFHKQPDYVILESLWSSKQQ